MKARRKVFQNSLSIKGRLVVVLKLCQFNWQLMTIVLITAVTLIVVKAMPLTSLRLARCSLVTRGEEARKETIGGTWG